MQWEQIIAIIKSDRGILAYQNFDYFELNVKLK